VPVTEMGESCEFEYCCYGNCDFEYFCCGTCSQGALRPARSTTGASNSNCSEGQMRTSTVASGPQFDAEATMAVPEPYYYSGHISALMFCALLLRNSQ